jgi:flagellar biosynthesis protein FliR
MRLSRPERIPDAMTDTDNPYQASDSVLPALDADAVPRVVKLAIAAYVAVYLTQAVLTASGEYGSMRNLMLMAIALKGAFVALIAIGLWARLPWARIWIAFATLFSLFGVAQLLGPGRHHMEAVAIATHVVRIAVTVLLFLPSARRWFARRRD